MDDEARRSDRVFAQERCETHDDLFKSPKKHVIGALKRKMEGFENQMATIRAQLEARRELTSSERTSILPAVNSSPKATSSSAVPSSSTDFLRFPLLRRIEGTRVANAPPKDPFLDVENVIHRTVTRECDTEERSTTARNAAQDSSMAGDVREKELDCWEQSASSKERGDRNNSAK
ncbi:hypothetical protein Pcac1_g3895 [Phytophthora cactorum]|nr:hypothetical protein Pcac1_g3895 [Phytophthora cactorum]